jgi:hypothetical protein
MPFLLLEIHRTRAAVGAAKLSSPAGSKLVLSGVPNRTASVVLDQITATGRHLAGKPANRKMRSVSLSTGVSGIRVISKCESVRGPDGE